MSLALTFGPQDIEHIYIKHKFLETEHSEAFRNSMSQLASTKFRVINKTHQTSKTSKTSCIISPKYGYKYMSM